MTTLPVNLCDRQLCENYLSSFGTRYFAVELHRVELWNSVNWMLMRNSSTLVLGWGLQPCMPRPCIPISKQSVIYHQVVSYLCRRSALNLTPNCTSNLCLPYKIWRRACRASRSIHQRFTNAHTQLRRILVYSLWMPILRI